MTGDPGTETRARTAPATVPLAVDGDGASEAVDRTAQGRVAPS